jgi:hypothetical protein
MSLKVLNRYIVAFCERGGEFVEVWIPADAGQGDKPDTAKPFVLPTSKKRPFLKDLTPAELREVERI